MNFFSLIFFCLQFNCASSALMLSNKIIFWQKPHLSSFTSTRNEVKPKLGVSYFFHTGNFVPGSMFVSLFLCLAISVCEQKFSEKTLNETRRCFDERFFHIFFYFPSLILFFILSLIKNDDEANNYVCLFCSIQRQMLLWKAKEFHFMFALQKIKRQKKMYLVWISLAFWPANQNDASTLWLWSRFSLICHCKPPNDGKCWLPFYQ